MAVTASVKLDVLAVQTNPLDLRDPRSKLRKRASVNYTNGTGANQANALYHAELTVAAPQTINLLGLTNQFGAAFDFSVVRSLTVTIVSGAGMQMDWSGVMGGPVIQTTALLWPGSAFTWSSPIGGMNVSVANADTITFTGAGVVDVVIIGIKV